jgi:ribosomal protein S18 acetylase RimI-like enzyme
VKYSRIELVAESEQEKLILEMCHLYFGEKYPYSRILGDSFQEDTLQEIGAGDVYVATNADAEIVGVCIICLPSLDARVEKYALKHNCDHYLAVLIVDERFRRKGYARDLFLYALTEKRGGIILITPERNIPSIAFYKGLGMEIVGTFDQNEYKIENGELFNLKRVVMTTSISNIFEAS